MIAFNGLGRPWVQTHSGKRFYLDTPRFDIDDIAHSLSMLCRFNGHTARFRSVAEHSIQVAYLMRQYTGGDPLEGLLHDATEAYLSDVPSPFKQVLPDWQRFDDAVDSQMRAHFGLPTEKTAECKKADWLSLFIEAFYLMPDRGASFDDPLLLRKQAIRLAETDPVLNICRFARPAWYGSVKCAFLSMYETQVALRGARQAAFQ